MDAGTQARAAARALFHACPVAKRFGVVFTLPEQLNTLTMHQPKLVYDTLFASAWQTLATFGKQLGVQLGIVAILHTWGQNLSLHPHLHCVVPGGGVRADGSGGPFVPMASFCST